ncbi:MAG: BMP family ABC transporter substrate-binding protein [Psychrobacillus sp.]
MNKISLVIGMIIFSLMITACSSPEIDSKNPQIKIGIMLSDAGLGDQSFSDLGFAGLERARDELNISFDYREIKDSETYENGLEELVQLENDLVIGLGFSMKEPMETIAKKYPDNSFLLIDAQSDLPNIYNITFKEEEASFLIGAIAGMKTKSNVVGFVGGEDNPIIQKFAKGFMEGVKSEKPNAEILIQYANTYNDEKLGEKIAKDFVENKADFIYPAAGFTGVGVIHESQRLGTYSFGVDSDQFYLAEKAVVTSMLKQVDQAVFNAVKEIVETGKIANKDSELGLKENGVDIAPIRIIDLSPSEEERLKKLRDDISNGNITLLK